MHTEPEDDIDLADPMVGTWILGQFRIVKRLAAGGMAEVYLAEQASMDRYAAIKIVRGSSAFLKELRHRLRQEARAASRLVHPNIITIYNFGELADGSLFLAMEYVEGVTLASVLERGGLPMQTVLDLTLQCANALNTAHEISIVHRDLKPDNIMVTEVAGRDHVKVLDFGLALMGGESSLTKPGHVMGTPRYMSPEQCRGEPATHAADQYALGLILYEMLTGEKAVTANSAMLFLLAHQNFEPKPPSQLVGVPGAELVDPIYFKMVAKDPNDRYETMDAVVAELEEAAEKFSQVNAEPIVASIEHPSPRDTDPTSASSDELLCVSDDSLQAPRLPEVVLLGSKSVLSNQGWVELQKSGFHLQTQCKLPEELASVSPEQTALWLLVVPKRRWKANWEAWIEAGMQPERTLVCIDASFDTPGIKRAADTFPNVMIGPHPLDPTGLSMALQWLHRNDSGGIECLPHNHAIQLIQISSSSDKSFYVDTLVEDARVEGIRQRVLRALAELSEEMILNAIFHAPVDHLGNKRLKMLDRAAELRLQPGEEPTLRWLVGDPHLAVSVQDPFGTLAAREVLERVCGGDKAPDIKSTTAGVGMGLRIMSRASQHLFFGICSGSWCEVLALVGRTPAVQKSGQKTLCILQGIGQQSRRIGDRLTLKEIKHQDKVRLELVGSINETSNMRPIFRHSGTVHLDLSRVSRVNSVGIRAWIEAARTAPSDLLLVFERVSPAVVSQLSMVPTLVEGASIASVMAPYFCETCDREELLLVRVEEIEGREPPSRTCASCGNEVEFDELAEEYFAFIEDRPQPQVPVTPSRDAPVAPPQPVPPAFLDGGSEAGSGFGTQGPAELPKAPQAPQVPRERAKPKRPKREPLVTRSKLPTHMGQPVVPPSTAAFTPTLPPTELKPLAAAAPTGPSAHEAAMTEKKEAEKKAAEAEQLELERHFRQVFEQYGTACRQCGTTMNLTFEAFEQYLNKNRATVMQQHGCRSVRFEIRIEDNQPTVKAFLVE